MIGDAVPPPNILILILWILYFMRCALLYVPFFSAFKKPLAIWIVCSFLFVCFGTVIYDGRIWHASIMFSVLVLCLWLAIGASPPHARPSLAILFLPGAISGFAYSILVAIYPLSHSSNVARWIVGNGHQNDLVIAAPDTMTAVIIGTKLKQPVFDPGCRCYPQFAVWSNRNQGALSETPNWIAMEMQRRDTHQALVVVPSNNRDFLPILADAKQFSVAILATFSNAVLTDENYIIFQITVPAAPR